jgi:hypothetical protein
MASLSDLPILFAIGYTPLGSLSASSELVLISFGWKLIITFHEQIGLVTFATYRRSRQRSILFSITSSMKRSEVDSTTFLGSPRTLSPSSSDNLINNAWIYT